MPHEAMIAQAFNHAPGTLSSWAGCPSTTVPALAREPAPVSLTGISVHFDVATLRCRCTLVSVHSGVGALWRRHARISSLPWWMRSWLISRRWTSLKLY